MNQEQLEEIYSQCEKNWDISFEDTDKNDNYINDFKKNFKKFLLNNTENERYATVKNELTSTLLEKFMYFSKKKVIDIYLDFYHMLHRRLNDSPDENYLESTIYSPIISSNKVKINSSYTYLEIYKEVTNTSSQQTVDFERAPELKEYLNFDEQEKLVYSLSEQDISTPLIDIMHYNPKKSETESLVDEIRALYNDRTIRRTILLDKLKKMIASTDSDPELDNKISALHLKYIDKIKYIDDLKNKRISDIHMMHVKWLQKKIEYVDIVIHFDDICGSGDTVIKYLRRYKEVLIKKHVIIHFLIMTRFAWETITKEKEAGGKLEDYDDEKLHIFYYKMSEGSLHEKAENHLKNISIDELEAFEKQVVIAQEIENEKNKNKILGYKKSQCLCAFYGNCPNNTLASYWFVENKNWAPLFPRRDNIIDYTTKPKNYDNFTRSKNIAIRLKDIEKEI